MQLIEVRDLRKMSHLLDKYSNLPSYHGNVTYSKGAILQQYNYYYY